MFTSSGLERTASINVTPLVDVCLVLLIIFLAASGSRFGYEAAIPREHSVLDAPPKGLPLVVRLGSGGEVFLNTEQIEPRLLVSMLRTSLRNRPDRLVFFASDGAASYGDAMSVIDAMSQAGAKIGISDGS